MFKKPGDITGNDPILFLFAVYLDCNFYIYVDAHFKQCSVEIWRYKC